MSSFANVSSRLTSPCVYTLDFLSQAMFPAQARAQHFVSVWQSNAYKITYADEVRQSLWTLPQEEMNIFFLETHLSKSYTPPVALHSCLGQRAVRKTLLWYLLCTWGGGSTLQEQGPGSGPWGFSDVWVNAVKTQSPCCAWSQPMNFLLISNLRTITWANADWRWVLLTHAMY